MAMCLTAHLAVSVHPSIHLSVTSWSSTKRVKLRIMQTTSYDTSGNLVSDAKNLCKIPMGLPQWGCQIIIPKYNNFRLKMAILDQYLGISQKRYKTGTQLLLKANRNLYAFYQMVLFPMTLSGP